MISLRCWLLLGFFFCVLPAHASTSCFDFSQKSTKLLHAAPTKFESGKNPSNFGTDSRNNDWGQVSGTVNKPILQLYEKLQNPKTIRNSNNTHVEVSNTETKDYLKLIRQQITIKPVFFITVEWQEDWAFSLREGTPEKPASIVVSYQKTDGTSHIKHLCGNILLQSLSPTTTGVYLYEEVQADRRSAEDVVNGITGTLRTLRE
ncbi:MAG: hypothetical protein H7333_06755 [Bdellovibrionales bacterium]|nr:hypothetical protein [Oligoflexia bacterium]